MASGGLPVLLSEVLEVRSGGLEEEEAWSVLARGLTPLRELIQNGEHSGSTGLAASSSLLSADSVYFQCDGSVHFIKQASVPAESSTLPQDSLSEDRFPAPPPELLKGGEGRTDNIDLNKVYVFAFGAVMKYAIEGSASSSPELYSVLNLMTLQNPSARLPLAKIEQIVQNQLQQRKIDPVEGVRNLYGVILGENGNEDVIDSSIAHHLDVDPFGQESIIIMEEGQQQPAMSSAMYPITSSSSSSSDVEAEVPKMAIVKDSGGTGSKSIGIVLEDDPNPNRPAVVDSSRETVIAVVLQYEDGFGRLLEDSDRRGTLEDLESSSADRFGSVDLLENRFGSMDQSDDHFGSVVQSENRLGSDDQSEDHFGSVDQSENHFRSTDQSEKRLGSPDRLENHFESMDQSPQNRLGSAGRPEIPLIPDIHNIRPDADGDELLKSKEPPIEEKIDSKSKSILSSFQDPDPIHHTDDFENRNSDLLDSPPGHSTAIIDTDHYHQDQHRSINIDFGAAIDEYSSIIDDEDVIISDSSTTVSSKQPPPNNQWVSFENDHHHQDHLQGQSSIEESSISRSIDPPPPDDDENTAVGISTNNNLEELFEIDQSESESAAAPPTFDRDPFSFFDHHHHHDQIAASKSAALIDNLDFRMAFPSDPSTPEKTTTKHNQQADQVGQIRHHEYSAAADQSGSSSTTSSGSTIGGKFKIFDHLMPTDPASFTHPRDHHHHHRRKNGKPSEERVLRSYHSVQCGYCSPRAAGGGGGKFKYGRFKSLQEISPSCTNLDTNGGMGLTVDTNEKINNYPPSILALRLSSPNNRGGVMDDALFASFENLSSSSATNTEPVEKEALLTVDQANRRIAPPKSIPAASLHYDHDDGLVISPTETSGIIGLSDDRSAATNNIIPASSVPPPRPPRKFDLLDKDMMVEKRRESSIEEGGGDKKVELCTSRRKSSSANNVGPRGQSPRPADKSSGGVPVLGVQQALAVVHHRRQQHLDLQQDDDQLQQQPSTSSDMGKPLKVSLASSSSAATVLSKRQQGDEDVVTTTTTSNTATTTTNNYRNPSFVRDSFSRSARRRPSAASLRIKQNEQQQQQPQPQQRITSNGNGSAIAMATATNGVGPEFIYKSRLPCIRLKAPSAKRKKLFRSSPDAIVHVILLNGQRVDVECHVDSTAEDVFQAVSSHTNVMESHFFGLTYLRDGEHFFLEPEEKLAKYAPSGWRSQHRDNSNSTSSSSVTNFSGSKSNYTLFFRLKFYPVSLDFVKTEQTLHQIYLQLRRDVIDERLQCGRENAYALAAIALQAEYGDRPNDNNTNYFHAEYYLPDPSTIEGVGGEHRVRGLLAELHGQYAGLGKAEAEVEYVRTCQVAREYGIHFHRIYRTKPSLLLTPSPLGDPDTGTPIWIGIMPRGVVIFEERVGERVAVSQHPWHTTHTLQFDHKRFVVVPQAQAQAQAQDPANAPRRLVFYTDNYRKSCYFVHFAAAQHRFCLRMRFWASTLPMDDHGASGACSLDHRRAPTGAAGGAGGHKNGRLQVASNLDSLVSNRSSETDSGISREASPEAREVYVGGEVHRERSVDAVLGPSSGRLTPRAQLRAAAGQHQRRAAPGQLQDEKMIDISIPSRGDASGFLSIEEALSESMEKRLDEATVENDPSNAASLSPSDYEAFRVRLCKDPQTGLGLTLVDGEIKGLKGVYVKSLTPGGPAELEGKIRTGDKLVWINGFDLEDKTRHDAVQLVRDASGEVEIGILRLKSFYSSNESIGSGGQIRPRADGRNMDAPDLGVQQQLRLPAHHNAICGFQHQGEDHQESSSTRIMKENNNNSDSSKFSGVTLDLDEFLEKDYRAGGVRFTANHGAQMYGGLGGDTEDEEEDEDHEDHVEEEGRGNEKRIRNIANPAWTGRKANSDDESATEQLGPVGFGDGSYLNIDKKKTVMKASKSQGDLADHQHRPDSIQSSMDSIIDQGSIENLQQMTVELEKNEHGSLGIQVAGGKGAKKVYVKALVAEPALSCPDILPGDQLASVNGVSTLNISHGDVVSLLKTAQSPVQLGLLRPSSSGAKSWNSKNAKYSTSSLSGSMTENAAVEAGKMTETLDVTLEKPSSGSLGLSLAKPRTGTGIYIRFINPASPAAAEGRLKEGDRLWKINGELVAQSTPEEVVEKLKAAQGNIHFVIRREAQQLSQQ